jgi:hypothetical protein
VGIAAALLAQACNRTPAVPTRVCQIPRDAQLQSLLTPLDLPTAVADLKAQGVKFDLYDKDDHPLPGAPPAGYAAVQPVVLVIITPDPQNNLFSKKDELLNVQYGADLRPTETYCQHLASGL